MKPFADDEVEIGVADEGNELIGVEEAAGVEVVEGVADGGVGGEGGELLA